MMITDVIRNMRRKQLDDARLTLESFRRLEAPTDIAIDTALELLDYLPPPDPVQSNDGGVELHDDQNSDNGWWSLQIEPDGRIDLFVGGDDGEWKLLTLTRVDGRGFQLVKKPC